MTRALVVLSLIIWAALVASLAIMLPWPWGLVTWVLLFAHMQIERLLGRR